jgi:hypothetical protein
MASTYLTRNPGSAGNRKKWTFSAWVKRAKLGSAQAMFTAGFSANNVDTLQFDASDQISWFSYDGNTDYAILTNAKFRDCNGWYHIQAVLDTGNATANDRVILYVNGERQSLATNTMPSQDYNGIFNNNSTAHYIGQYGWNSNAYFDGEMSHVHFSDGYALAPTIFGSTDSTTGEWKINTSPSFTLGTNGFTILKDGNTITDQSSNSNNWTVAAGTLTKTEDCPSNVFATWNPLMPQSAIYSNGNTSVNQTTDASYRPIYSTIATPTTGKFYAEFKAVSGFDNINKAVGFIDVDLTFAPTAHIEAYSTSGSYGANGRASYNGTADTSVPQYTNGDIIGIALDLDNGKSYFHKNGTYINSGNPTTGSNGYTVTTGKSYAFVAIVINQGGSNLWSANFGNGYFGTTAVSSAGTNASGLGIFEYDVPTGYTALCTKGLNE